MNAGLEFEHEFTSSNRRMRLLEAVMSNSR
jgi:hypothetical protein